MPQEFWWFQRHIVLDTRVGKLVVLVRKMFGRITILIFLAHMSALKPPRQKIFDPRNSGQSSSQHFWNDLELYSDFS